MEFYLLAVAILFLIPFPKKWKFVWQLRFIGMAMVALIAGVTTLIQKPETLQFAGGISLIVLALVFFYLALRGNKAKKKLNSSK